MRHKIILPILLLSLFVIKDVSAQMAGLNFTLGFPQGEFKNNVRRTAYGGSINYNFFQPAPDRPFTIGVNLGFMNLGSESRREYFSSTIPDVFVDVDRTNNIVNFHLLFQIMYPEGMIRPYIEGLFGGSYLFTETKITSQNTQQEVASSNNMTDFAWSYGGGAGILVKISDGVTPNMGNIFLDFKVRYLYGTEAEYLTPGSIIISQGRAYYLVSKSKTDMVTANIGAVLTFNSIF